MCFHYTKKKHNGNNTNSSFLFNSFENYHISKKKVKENLEVKHMLVNSEQYQMEAEVANTVSVFCKRASWMDDNFSTPAGHQSFSEIILFTHINT